MLLTFLVRLTLRPDCGCKKCEAEAKRLESSGACQKKANEDLVRAWLPGLAELEGLAADAPEASSDIGAMIEQRLAGGGNG